MTRSEDVRPRSATRQPPGKVNGARDAARTGARRRGAGNGASTSSARKPSRATPAKPSTGNGNSGEQPIVKPADAVDGPTWAETIATLAAPDELDPDDIAILTRWTQIAAAPPEVSAAPPASEHAARPRDGNVIDTTADEAPLVDEPATTDAVVVETTAKHVAPAEATFVETAEDVVPADATVVETTPAGEAPEDEPAVAEGTVADGAITETVWVEPAVLEPAVGEPAVEEPAALEPVVEPAETTGVLGTLGIPPVVMEKARAFTLWRRRRPRVRKVTRVVRRIDAWSVLKISLLFYAVLFVILLVAGVLLWNLAMSTGTVRNVEGFIRDLFNLETFHVSGQDLFRASWTLGLFLVIGGTGLNVTMAVLFNLISDLVGGVRVTVLEEEVVLRPRTANVSGRPAPPGAGRTTDTGPEVAFVADPPAPTIDGS